MKSFTQRLALCLLALCVPAMASDKCIGGAGGVKYPLSEQYSVAIEGGTGEHAGKCHVLISGPAGAVFDNYSYDVQVDPFSGKDVNNDGKPDMILFGHVNSRQDPLTYWIISFAEPAFLARQITTVYPLTFEDRDGDGKMEIWTREWVFNGIDGLDEDDSPHPQIAFRLVGNRLIYVSNLFASEYEPEIADARTRLTENAVSLFKNETSPGHPASEKDDKPKDDPKSERTRLEVKSATLKVVLAYIYAGKTAEAMKQLGDDWPYNDRDRIRQIILRTRQNGMLRQLNAPQPAAAPGAQQSSAAPPAPVSTPPQ